MTKIVNSWNEWSPLRHVILGRPEGSNIPAPEPAWAYDLPEGGYPMGSWGPLPQEMVDAANEQMDFFAAQLEQRGVTVERPTIQPFMFNKPLSHPDWTQLNAYGANNSRDVLLCHGNRIVEAAVSQRSRYWEHLNFRPLFEKYFEEDPEFVYVAAPKGRLIDESYVKNYYYYKYRVWTSEEQERLAEEGRWQLTEREPMWDAADVGRFGKDLFVQLSSTTNHAAVDWLRRFFRELGIRVHKVRFATEDSNNRLGAHHPRHIDATLTPLRPGLAMYCPSEAPRDPELIELFKKNDWELVAAAEPMFFHDDVVSLSALTPRGPSWMSMNTFSLDEKTVFVQAGEDRYAEQLTKLGFEAIPIPYEKVNPFGGGLHCTTLDVYREGACEDYFPRQIEGY